MMNWCTQGVLAVTTAILLLSPVVCAQAVEGESIFVIPESENRSSYPLERHYTISELAEVSIGSNTTIYFLPGKHIAGRHNVTGIEITNVMITAAHTASPTVVEIECVSSFAFLFIRVANLTISGLSFNNCGVAARPYYNHYTIIATVSISHCTNVTIDNVVVSNGRGIGLFVLDVHEYLNLSNSVLKHNNINCHVESDVTVPKHMVNVHIFNSVFSFGDYEIYPVLGTYASGITVIFNSYLRIVMTVSNVTVDSNRGNYGNIFIELALPHSEMIRGTANVDIEHLKSINSSGIYSRGLFIWYRGIHTLSISITDSTFQHKGLYIGITRGYDHDPIQYFLPITQVIGYSHLVHLERLLITETKTTDDNSEIVAPVSLNLHTVKKAFLKDIILSGNAAPLNVLILASNVFLQGHNTMSDNRGSIILRRNSTLTFDEGSVTHVTNNWLTDTELGVAVLLAEDSNLGFHRNSYVRFESNRALGCGGITTSKSTLNFEWNSTVIFSDNEGNNGGAMALYDKSVLYFLEDNVTVQFTGNKARNKGGALFVEDSGYRKRLHYKHYITPIVRSYSFVSASRMEFTNNTAEVAGDEIFGGWIAWPYNEIASYYQTLIVYSMNSFDIVTNSDFSAVSSHPVRMCMCANSSPNCNISNHTVWSFPGQPVQLEAVAVGQSFGTVPSTVLAELKNSSSKGEIDRGQTLQSVGRYCTPLEYTVTSENKFEPIMLRASVDQKSIPTFPKDNALRNYLIRQQPLLYSHLSTLFTQFSITVHFKSCPLGYVFNHNRCSCHQYLLAQGIVCNTTDYSVQRPASKWIDATIVHDTATTIDQLVVIVHDHCPFGYCRSESVSMQLESPDEQCYFNRSGTLCGACRSNLSQVFGTSNCKTCSSLWVLLLFPVVIMVGIALVVFLMVLDLTVSIGTINGLIFYANIVRANQAVFFPSDSANTFLSWFIAWLNLDLGVETCFYDGLNAYVKTWLQFVFPVYIWLLVLGIIISSHYSLTVSKVIGNNAVSVLATLFLLSYIKVVRTIITVFRYTELVYSNGEQKKVWLYDGNIDYLKGKHIPLFLCALVYLILLSIPYTATVFEIQWIRKFVCSTCDRCFSLWAGRFMPILDAHSGPYKDKHRYWTGLLLLVRVGLLLVFSLNISGDPSVNLLTISVTILCLLTYISLIRGPYKSWPINLIEVSFYLNTGLLSSTTLYKLTTEANPTSVTFTSTSIAFVTFCVLVFYHALQRIVSTKRGGEMKEAIQKRARLLLRRQEAEGAGEVTPQGTAAGKTGTHHSIELREPLLV